MSEGFLFTVEQLKKGRYRWVMSNGTEWAGHTLPPLFNKCDEHLIGLFDTVKGIMVYRRNHETGYLEETDEFEEFINNARERTE